MGLVAANHVVAARASVPTRAAAGAGPAPIARAADKPPRTRAQPTRRSRVLDLFGEHGQVIVISLSLNLILLAFFIVLNGTVRLDQARASAAIDSLRREFSAPAALGDPAPGDPAPGDSFRAQAHDALRNAVSAAFAAVLDGREVVLHAAAERVDVRVPAAALIDPASAGLRPNLPVLDRIAAALAAPPAGLRYAVMVAVDPQPDRAVVADAAGAVARALADRGVEPALIAAGMATSSQAPGSGFIFSFLVLDEHAAAAPAFGRGGVEDLP